MRSLGAADAAANQRSDEFASSLQYGAVVYGKAPRLFEELRELLGEETVLAALRSYVDEFAFAIARPDDLRHALRNAEPGRADEVDALWTRWFEEAHGDEDIGLGSPLGGLGGLEGLGGLSGLEGLGGLEGLEGLEALGPEFQELLGLILESLGDG